MKYGATYVYKVKAGKWKGYIDCYDEDGTRRRRTKALKSTLKKDAEREIEEYRLSLVEQDEAGVAVSGAEGPAVAYIAGYLNDLAESGEIAAATANCYRSALHHIEDGFSGVKLRDLDALRIERWERKMKADGVSSSVIKKCHSLISGALRKASKYHLIDRNPVADVDPPKYEKVKKGINSLSDEEVKRLLDALDAKRPNPAGGEPVRVAELNRVNVAARLALLCGLRIQEVCGLRWKDVDLEGGTLYVKNVIGRDGGKTYEKEPKTGKERDVAMPAYLVEVLTEWRGIQEKEFGGLGARLCAEAYVIGDVDGYQNPVTLSKKWSALAEAYGVKGIEGRRPTFHDLRHTYATMTVAAGADAEAVAALMGHSNVSMTLNTYATSLPKAKRAAAGALGDLLGR